MRVIVAPDIYEPKPGDITVFLAGGITNCPDWQKEVIKTIEDGDVEAIHSVEYDTENLVIFNPRRDNFPIDDPNAAEEQIAWEYAHLERCDIFSMYFSGGESDQPICMYELGRNILLKEIKHGPIPALLDYAIVSVNGVYKRAADVYHQMYLAGYRSLVGMEANPLSHAMKIYRTYQKLDRKRKEALKTQRSIQNGR